MRVTGYPICFKIGMFNAAFDWRIQRKRFIWLAVNFVTVSQILFNASSSNQRLPIARTELLI